MSDLTFRRARGVCRAYRPMTAVVLFEPCEGRRLLAFTGAIFTTDVNGNAVNQNLYANRQDVYLNGGPNNANGPSLPVGEYYVQVTEPNGALLGTSVGRPGDETPIEVTDASDGTPGDGKGVFSGYQVWDITQKASDPSAKGYDITSNPGGEYKVWISQVSFASSAFKSSDSKTDNFKVEEDAPPPPPPVTHDIKGLKFYDTDTDGVQDAGEPGLPGWKIFIDADSDGVYDVGELSTVTGAGGAYVFEDMPIGTYQVFEDLVNAPSPGVGNTWVQTLGVGGITATVTTAGTLPASVDFGNVRIGAGNGRTLGFWSNKNGQALIESKIALGVNIYAELTSLNLRNANGSNFDPANYSSLRTWLLNGTATNMAYMLSVQMATMKISVLTGLVSATALIKATGAAAANPAGFATVGAIINEANGLLAGAGNLTVLSGNPLRPQMELIKNILDQANNNLTFVLLPPV